MFYEILQLLFVNLKRSQINLNLRVTVTTHLNAPGEKNNYVGTYLAKNVSHKQCEEPRAFHIPSGVAIF